MVRFEPVTADNIVNTLPFFNEASDRICDDTAGVTFQWRNLFHTDILMQDGFLVTRSFFPQVGTCYSFPIGHGNLAKIILTLREDAAANNIPLRFACVTEKRIEILKAFIGDHFSIEEKRSWADYLYDPTNFNYLGKRFHTQRNHVNRFYLEYPDTVLTPVTDDNASEVKSFLDHILTIKAEMPEWERGEVKGTQDLLDLRKELHQIGAFLKTRKGIAAYAMGEIQGDTLHIHAEKADTSFNGAYPAMAQAFAAYAGKNVTYINREDDAGDPGIRFSKEQYRPVCLISKYLVTVEE